MTIQANTTPLYVDLQMCDAPHIGGVSGYLTVDGLSPVIGQTMAMDVGGGVMDKAVVTGFRTDQVPAGYLPINYTSATEPCGDFVSGYGDGCMDPLANNYDETALTDDDSCTFDEIIVDDVDTDLDAPLGVQTAGFMGLPKIAWIAIIGAGLYYAYSKGMLKKFMK
jgi:hypothetical protein